MTKAREIGRAAAALEAGERVAARIAARQGSAAHGRAARFLALQARQEAFHARVSAAAAAVLAPGAAVANPAVGALAALGARLERDLDAGDLAASIVGLQVALEALGIAVLGQLEAVVSVHVPGLSAIHRRIAVQEAAHHAFGLRYVERACARGELSAVRRTAAAREYGVLARGVLHACVEIIDGCGVPAERYATAFTAALPGWFRTADGA